MRVSDILRLPGELVPQVPHSLLCVVAEHHDVPDEVDGATYKRVVHREGDQNGKYGREVGVLYVGDRAAALCLCRGKWGHSWEVVVLDRDAFVSLRVALLLASRRHEAVPADHDVWGLLYLDDVAMLLSAGIVDSRPPPARAEGVEHLCHLIHLQGMREGVEVAAVETSGEVLARPTDLVRRVVSGLSNVRLERCEHEHEHMIDCVRLTLTAGPA